MAIKHNNVLLNLITGCLYWLTTCFGQLTFSRLMTYIYVVPHR